jgi:putative membrane protein
LSSTYFSSDERQAPGQSPTEALAARYRHLFVLPSKTTLIVLNAVAAIILSVAVAGGAPPLTFVAASLLAALLVPLAISLASKSIDSTTIATFRRSLAATFVGTLLWLICVAIGFVYAHASGSTSSLGNSFVFGAFLCGGFETIVINGAFVEQTAASVLLGSLQPAITAASILMTGGLAFRGYAAIPGAVAFGLLTLFTVSLKRMKTSKGHSAVKLFQSFMKTWADNDASGLESIIASHAEKTEVSSKIMRFQGSEGDFFFVLPGVHPGPFYPVGSYNMPDLVSKAFEGVGQVLTLHRPGGHERNLATNAGAKDYARQLKEFAVALGPTKPVAVRGPTTAKIGKATTTLSGLGDHMLLTVSFAPYGSDDLELDFERQLSAVASSEGSDISIVDAHNSIEDGRENADPSDSQWRKLIQDVKRAPQTEFRAGFARSQENELPPSSDITANGIGLVVLEVQKTKWVLALADANNSVPGLRSVVSTALESSGYKLLEFCTSDSHDLAARGLTVNRGYKALGEATPVDTIAKSTVGLTKIAESRLSECRFAAGTLTSEVSLFGAGALDEFAAIARNSSVFAKRYAEVGTLSLAVLLLLSIFL